MKWLTADSDKVIGQLGSDGAFIDKDYAKKHLLDVGSPLTLTGPERRVGRCSR